MKKCKLCNQVKELSEFQKNSRYKDGYYKHCKKCHYEEYGRAAHFRRSYGITQEDFDILLKKQNYKCYACGFVQGSFKTDRLFVDHCHSTGKIRGLLCQGCNIALGGVKDKIETLKKLIEYLENSQ
jgi:hypothetical protein